MPTTRDIIFARFGPHVFEPGYFFVHRDSLRFELNREGPRLELFIQAFDRAREVLGHAFRNTPELTIVLEATGPQRLLCHKPLFRDLRDCGLRVTRPLDCWAVEWAGEWEPAVHTSIAFTAEPDSLDRWIWGAVARDIGIHPRLRSRVFLVDAANGLLAYPYDDRGMDIIGADTGAVQDLYDRFKHCLLPHDLPLMRERFDGSTGVANSGG